MIEKYPGLVEKLEELNKLNEEIQAKRKDDKAPSVEEWLVEKNNLQTQLDEKMAILYQMASESRSIPSKELAATQLHYFESVRQFFANYQNMDNSETHLLHAEYAFDYAIQNTRYALLSSLIAIDLAEREEENERN